MYDYTATTRKPKFYFVFCTLLTLAVLLASACLLVFFISVLVKTDGFVPITNPFVGFWWGFFLFIWSTILFLAVSTRKFSKLCDFKCGWWTLNIFSVMSFLGSLVACGCLFVTNDPWGGAVTLVVSIVSIGNVVAVIRRLQDPADALEGYATLLSNRHGSMNYSTEFGAEDINSIFDDESDSPMLFHRKEKPKKGLGGVFCAALLVLLNIFVLAVLIFQAFAVYQSVALAADHRDTAYYPGNFFPVTEHKYKLRLNCVGGLLPARNGSSPTIILESGLGGVTPYWSYVLPGLANLTRVCEYDRAGYGWSQSGVLPRSSQQIAQELKELLVTAGEAGPYLVMGHSFGGMNARMFASLYRSEVVGLVLIDSAHEFQQKYFEEASTALPPSMSEAQGTIFGVPPLLIARAVAPLGFMRIAMKWMPNILPQHISPLLRNQILSLQSTNSYPNAVWSESENMPTLSSLQVNATRADGLADMPLVVLSAGASINGTCAEIGYTPDSVECNNWINTIKVYGPVQFDLQKDLASLSTNVQWRIIWGSGHFIQIDAPDAVIDAASWVISQL